MTTSTLQDVASATDSAGLSHRDEDLLDGIVTAAALVADANGEIHPAERTALADFIDHNGFVSGFTHPEIVDAFERCAQRLKASGGAKDAIDSLRRFEGGASAHLIAEVGERIAKTDSHVQAGELHVLQLICTVLGVPRVNPDCADVT